MRSGFAIRLWFAEKQTVLSKDGAEQRVSFSILFYGHHDGPDAVVFPKDGENLKRSSATIRHRSAAIMTKQGNRLLYSFGGAVNPAKHVANAKSVQVQPALVSRLNENVPFQTARCAGAALA